jgi:hypothetical protein
MQAVRRLLRPGFVVLAALAFVIATRQLGNHPPPVSDGGLMVVLPAHVQTLLAAGDRHLAANVGVFRVMAYPLDLLTAETTLVKAHIQEETSRLNPAHEDNYYLASATLEEKQLAPPLFKVLERATEARPFDVLPPLYLGLSYGFLLNDYVRGASYLQLASTREIGKDERNRMALEQLAAKWAARGVDPEAGLRFLEAMSRDARSQKMRAYFNERIRALRGVLDLRKAIQRFIDEKGRRPASLDELVTAGFLDQMPIPARGYAYALDENGMPLHLRLGVPVR